MITLLEVIAILTLLEILWLVPNSMWLEGYLDYASTYAASFASAAVKGESPKLARVCFRHSRFNNALA